MTNIVIVGAGFGGLQTALRLEKKFKHRKGIALTLIDRRDYHLFTPNLYKAATAEEELVTVKQVKQSISLSLREILSGKNIKFLKGNLNSVEPAKKQVLVDNKQIHYDYLILALGSQSDFLNIAGAERYALTLKSLPDALRFRNNIEFAIQASKLDFSKSNLRVVVAGGGYTGLELAGELRGLVDYLAWKNDYPREKIEIEIIEANSQLIGGFNKRLSEDVYLRLQELNIRIQLSSRITGVDGHFIELMSGEKVAYDCLVWTAGVKACRLTFNGLVNLDRKSRLLVNGWFAVGDYQNIFALGDMACVLDETGQPVPSSAQDAVDQAKYLAYALPFIMKNQKPARAYAPIQHGFIVNLGGKWAILSYGRFYIKGFLAYFLNQLAHLDYYISVVGVWRAIKCLIFQTEIYSRND